VRDQSALKGTASTPTHGGRVVKDRSKPRAGWALLSMLLASFVAAAPPPVRLVELSSHSAVLETPEGLKLVRVGDRVPGLDARVVHVDSARLLVEFASNATTRGGILEVKRGRSLSPPVAGKTSRRAVAISAEMLEAGKGGD
jgi:hypothetical protein